MSTVNKSNYDTKIDLEGGGASDIFRAKTAVGMASHPKSLSMEEKKYLLAVERGDMANVRRLLQKAYRLKSFDVNCVDSLGRGALTLAIDGENLEMVELLVIMGVETKDALLHAINVEFVEAVELLLEHEELIHKEGELYSWQKVDINTAQFTPDITPLVLAAHRNNYEILKMLLDRGATLPMPHDIKCGCEECIRESTEDSLRHSLSRVNEYKALASPSLIALSSSDPILTAFQLSWELRTLAFAEQESKSEYLELRRQCQQFAVDLLHQSRSSQELAIILNHDPESPPYEEGEHMKLARLELAVNYKQKKFVAHPNIQQLLAAIWYEGVPGFRRMKAGNKLKIILRTAVLFPLYCLLYMAAPTTQTGKLMRKPFMKFLIHASSYLFFLFLLILVSQRAEVQVIELFGTEAMRKRLQEALLKQRGNTPTILEYTVLVYVLGFIYEETHEIYVEGIKSYLRNMWNFIDFTRNTLYVLVAALRLMAYVQQMNEISKDPSTAYIPREEWDPFDPQLIAEGLFAAANIFSALKLVHLFSINPHLGPLQISLGRMVIDIIKFFFIYSLVLFAFACGLNQLLWYFAELERRKCYILPGGLPDWANNGDSCMKWRSFANVFESSQSLFWASFGMVGLENFELSGIKTYTRFWGLLMFGSYSVINVIVLLNLLIAMMSNSYAMIDEHSDTEWKFARTKLWMSYFEESATLPPPFNIFPTPKMIFKLLGLRKKDKIRRMSSKKRAKEEKERDYRYSAVIRALVWRYVTTMHRKCEEEAVTEDDINEVKGDISAFRYEMLEVLSKNGMDISCAEKREKTILGKRMKIWERRLMKDFKVVPVATEEEMDQLIYEPPPENEDSLAKFRRIAKLAVLNSSLHKWGQVVKGVCEASQIGKSNSRESLKSQQNLIKAMKEAKKFVKSAPLPEVSSRSVSPIELPDTTSSSIMEIIKDISQETQDDSSKSSGSGQNVNVSSLAGILKHRDSRKKIAAAIAGTTPNISITAPTPSMPTKVPANAEKALKSERATSPTNDTVAKKSQTEIIKTVAEVSKTDKEVLQHRASDCPSVSTSDKEMLAAVRSKTPDSLSSTASDKTGTKISTISPKSPIKIPATTVAAVGDKKEGETASKSTVNVDTKINTASETPATTKLSPIKSRTPSPDPGNKPKSSTDEPPRVKSPSPPSSSIKPRAPSPTVEKSVTAEAAEKDISVAVKSPTTKPKAPSPVKEPEDKSKSSTVIEKIPPPPTSVKKYQAPQPQQQQIQITTKSEDSSKVTSVPIPVIAKQTVMITKPDNSENKAIATIDSTPSRSTENLIPQEKQPSPYKSKGIKPIYRQPKTGWL